jgi:regulator of sigma D
MKIIFKPHELELVKKIHIALGRNVEPVNEMAQDRKIELKSEKDLALDLEQKMREIGQKPEDPGQGRRTK